jgi:hypothetical protein
VRVGVNFQPRTPLTRGKQRFGAHPEEDQGSVFSPGDPVLASLPRSSPGFFCRDFS